MAKRYLEFDQTPDDGMIPIGFSSMASINGVDLKKKIISLMSSEKELGIRKCIDLLISECLCSKQDAGKLMKKIHNDYKNFGANYVINREYIYQINKIFWGFEEDIPENDLRYFKLDNVIDVRNAKNIKDVQSIIEKYNEDKIGKVVQRFCNIRESTSNEKH